MTKHNKTSASCEYSFNVIGLTFLIISSVIGAGFASGAEILVFFGNSTIPAWGIAILVAASMFFFMGVIIWLNENDFKPPKILFVPIYFLFLVAMTAGVAGLVGWVGAIASLVACIFIVLYGFEKLMGFNKYLIWLVLVVLFFITTTQINFAPRSSHDPVPFQGLARTFFSAIIYSGMNMLIFPIIHRARTKFKPKEIFMSCLLACLILGVLVFLLLYTLRGYKDTTFPVLMLNDGFLIVVMVFLCIFSSQFIHLFNIDSSSTTKTTRRPQRLLIICSAAFILSLFGFTRIIGFVYPIVGIMMIFFLAYSVFHCLISRRIRRRQSHHQPRS